MKATETLVVTGDSAIAHDTIVIHPNDGFDLDLVTRSNALRILAAAPRAGGGTPAADDGTGTVLLENECPCGTLRMSLAIWRETGRFRRARLYRDGDTILIAKE